MSEYIAFFLSIIPLAVLIFLILKIKFPIHFSVLIALILAWILSFTYWNMSFSGLTAATIYGATKGLWPIVIVILAAIFSYNLMLKTGSMETIKQMLASISHDQRIQALIIAWGFGGFLEAVAGYGTAVAIPIGILVALGTNPFKAAVVSLLANTVPTAFGAVGIPVSVLAEQTNLPVLALGSTIVKQLAIFNILLPFIIVMIIGDGIKAIKGVFLITLSCGIATLIPQYFVAHYIGAELPAFAGSLSALLITIILAKKQNKSKQNENAQEKIPTKKIINATIIYILTFVLILLCSPIFPTIKNFFGQIASTIPFTISPTQTLQLKIEWLITPGVLILIATLIGGKLQGASSKMVFSTFIETFWQLKNSIFAIMCIVALATIMDVSGMINDIATTLVKITGSAYILIAPFIGALGTFVTGSDTNANILFGKLQTTAATQLNIDPNMLAAANTAGATGGKMISPQSISIAVSATKMENQSSKIMSNNIKYCVAYVSLLGIILGLSHFLF